MKTTSIKSFGAIAVLGTALALLSGCLNLFDPFDNASSDTQLISAARACFDRGDFTCAQQQYAKLSVNSASIRDSETVFSQLDQLGAGMSSFIRAVGNGSTNAGALVTSLAGDLSKNASETTRKAIFASYVTAKGISTADPQTRGLTRFIAAIALMAEMLGEDAGVVGTYSATDLVSSVTGCAALTAGTCTGAPCNDGGTKLITHDAAISSTADLDTKTAADYTGAITDAMLHYALKSVQSGLTEMGGNTGVSGSALDLASALTALTGTANCYRWGLLTNNVGKR